MSQTIIGLDLSLRSTGAVAVPVDWDIKWGQVETMVVGYPLENATTEQKCIRIRAIVKAVAVFVEKHNPDEIWMEELAFNSRGSRSQEISGLTWMVRVTLFSMGYVVKMVTAAAGRKRFLGKLPRKGQKVAVQLALQDLGAPFSGQDDTCDAFVVANYGLSEAGGRSLMLAA